MLGRLGASTYSVVLAQHHALVRSGLTEYDGQEVGTQGDGFFAVFRSPSACVAAAIEIQRSLDAYQWPDGERIRVRMGIHVGEASETATGLVGIEVHRAARVAAVAHGGQILLSEAVAALVCDSLPSGVAARDLGLHHLKDLGRAEHIFQLDAPGLRAQFPPIHTLDQSTLANNLPTNVATFVGRSNELKEVRELVESSRLVTITGAGGSGKTRLALQVATEFLSSCRDGVWLVELAAISDPNGVALAVSHVIGVTSRSAESTLDTLVTTIGPQDMLLVLDNCEHIIDACAKVADAVVRRCPKVRLVTTSRESLGIGGEVIYRVPSLSLPPSDEVAMSAFETSDAVALFVERARSQAVEIQPDAETARLVVSTCRRLDGMPLAIELAAARLRSLSLTELHDLLDQRFLLLTGGSRSALERQQTLRATVDWSYSLLNSREQAVLRRLSIFIDGFEISAARAVCGFGDIESFDVTDLLGSLVDKSLVMAEAADGSFRYRLLETIRQFAAEILVAGDGLEAREVATAHCHYFLLLAEEAESHLTGSDQGRWLTRLENDHANLQRAIDHAAQDDGQTALVLRFVIALRMFWLARSRRVEAVAVFLPALENPQAALELPLLLEALISASHIARHVDLPMSRRLGERAVELAREVDDERLAVSAQVSLGGVKYFAGDFEGAYLLGRQNLEKARAINDQTVLAITLGLCVMASEVVAPEQTSSLFSEGIACTEQSGNLFFTADFHNTAGVHALYEGDVPRARTHLEKAAAINDLLGLNMYHMRINLGLVLREEEDLLGARSMLVDALYISRRTGDWYGIAYSMLGLAIVASDRYEWQRCAVLHGVSQAFLDRIGLPWLSYYVTIRKASKERAQASLGGAEFSRWYAKGEIMNLEDAFDFAVQLELNGP